MPVHEKDFVIIMKNVNWDNIYQGNSTKSVPESSHDKKGKYGGVSSYTDSDVAEAKTYMQEVLDVQEMTINGCALEHILAEVYGFAHQHANKTISELNSKVVYVGVLESTVQQYGQTIDAQSKEIVRLQEELSHSAKYVEAAKKIDKEQVAETSTGRRIKE